MIMPVGMLFVLSQTLLSPDVRAVYGAKSGLFATARQLLNEYLEHRCVPATVRIKLADMSGAINEAVRDMACECNFSLSARYVWPDIPAFACRDIPLMANGEIAVTAKVMTFMLRSPVEHPPGLVW
jgi:hypothetical protein